MMVHFVGDTTDMTGFLISRLGLDRAERGWTSKRFTDHSQSSSSHSFGQLIRIKESIFAAGGHRLKRLAPTRSGFDAAR